MNKRINNAYVLLQKILYISLLIGFGILVPLYFNNAYYDIMDVKASLAALITIILLPLALVILVLKIIDKKIFTNNKQLCIGLICLIITTILSSCLSYDPINTITGSQGWYIGSFIIVSMCIFILSLNDIPKINNKYYIPIIITIGIIYILSIIDSTGIDLLGFKNNIDKSFYYDYVATIGNINWYVGYLSLTSIFFISSYIIEDNRIKKIIFLILSILSTYNIASIGSDGIYLAIEYSLFGFIPFLLSNLNRFKRLSIIIFSYCVSLLILRHINYPLNGYCSYTISLPFIIICLFLSAAMYMIPFLSNNKYSNRVNKIVIIVLESLLLFINIAIVIFVIIKNDPNFGSGRYEIWQHSFNNFIFFSFKDKIFGLGPELLNSVYAYLSINKGVIYQTSHSEPIQILLTMGISGSIIWLYCVKTLLIPYFKNRLWNSKNAPLYIALIAYLGQSLINSATTLNIVTMVLIIIILNSKN